MFVILMIKKVSVSTQKAICLQERFRANRKLSVYSYIQTKRFLFVLKKLSVCYFDEQKGFCEHAKSYLPVRKLSVCRQKANFVLTESFLFIHIFKQKGFCLCSES